MRSFEFAEAAKRLGQTTRAAGYETPIFRGPPKRPGVNRTINRTKQTTTVSVALAGRPLVAVVADMIDGIVIANELTTVEASRLRDSLWMATADLYEQAAAHELAA